MTSSFPRYALALGLLAGLVFSSPVRAQGSDTLAPVIVDTLIQPYLRIQQTLAEDDFDGATSRGEDFLQMLSVAPGTDRMEGFRDLFEPTEDLAEARNLGAARRAFADLSAQFIAVVKEVGTLESVVVMHCPMAFDGDGAEWIQRGNQPSNPYFGAAMLTCGEVKDELGPGFDFEEEPSASETPAPTPPGVE
ncbi:MAG: DUF3347 domain-containing protein [Verrucomicrobiota bacterium]